MKFVKVLIISLFISLSCFAQSFENTAVPFTLADRDRIVRTEQKLEAFQKNVDERFKGIDEKFASLRNEINTKFDAQQMQFEALQKQLDNIYTLMFFVLGAIMSLIGFVIYDRRTAIKPVQREQENIIRVLREYSAKHNDLSELLKNAGML
jgi:hypothetical protein